MSKVARKAAVRAKLNEAKKYEPSWTSEELTPDSVISTTLNWYNSHTDVKWAAKVLGCEPNVAQFFQTLASAKRMIARGFKHSEKHLKSIQRMQDEFDARVRKVTPVAPAPTAAETRAKIDEGIKSRIDHFIAELEGAIDDYVLAPKSEDKFNPYDWMQAAGVKPTHAKAISEYFRERVREPLIAESGKDEELAEAYSTYSKARLRGLIAFIANIIKDAERLMTNQKAARKPRAKKAPSAAKVVSKLKYKQSDDKLKIKSVEPTNVLGASQVWVYNTKTRKLGVYHTNSPDGISIKGSSLTNYSEAASISKTLRKPEKVLSQVLGAGKVELRKLMTEINSKESLLNGRMNGDTVILRVIK
jgi:hypothetical protein